jgi:hypothetical protein
MKHAVEQTSIKGVVADESQMEPMTEQSANT